MNKTKIEWATMTWNPVTGCFHNCPYCYAARYVNRFGLRFAPMLGDPGMEGACKYDTDEEGQDSMLELKRPYFNWHEGIRNSYPMGFAPTFHKYRLNEPEKYKKPQTVFVCSMADLFGNWVPKTWIERVFNACKKAPQHRYVFLTKNGSRYQEFMRKMPDNMWFGQTITQSDLDWNYRHIVYPHKSWNRMTCIEPMQNSFPYFNAQNTGWVIIGAETGNRKGKVIPQRGWIERIVDACRHDNKPVFMKRSLQEIWGEPLIQEYPWEGGN